jgi:hypothetical protein
MPIHTEADMDELIAEVMQQSRNPLDRLTTSVETANALAELGDSLVSHFVEQARDAGHSWAEIGTSLGVSRQAAQQRHAADRFQKAPIGAGGVREKAAPFVALRRNEQGDIQVMVENNTAWQVLVEMAGHPIEAWIEAARKVDPRRWLKRLGEDLDVVARELGVELESKIGLVLQDSAGRRAGREAEVTIAKRRSAVVFNRG